MKPLIFLLAIMSLGACQTQPEMHAVGIMVPELEQPNHQRYQVYVSFLSSMNLAGDVLRQERVNRLRKSFNDFADGIGANSAAVWIVPPLVKHQQEFAKGMHDRYRLAYSYGPYVIISNVSPLSDASATQPRVVLDFSDTSPERIQVVLDELQQQIRKSVINTDKLMLIHSREIVMSKVVDYSSVTRELLLAFVRRK